MHHKNEEVIWREVMVRRNHGSGFNSRLDRLDGPMKQFQTLVQNLASRAFKTQLILYGHWKPS